MMFKRKIRILFVMPASLFLGGCFLDTDNGTPEITDDPPSITQSVARQWNEALLSAIRLDFARPTVHARNLFHTSVAMYDAWAVFDDVAQPYLLGKTVNGFSCDFTGITNPAIIKTARQQAISYASYRILSHRFSNSPGTIESQKVFDDLLSELGYEASFTSTDYSSGSAAALGNHIAECMIAYGLQDGANEANAYAVQSYAPLNPPLAPSATGNPDIVDLNRWQPLSLDNFIDQSGNEIGASTPEFVGPEWGSVAAFALAETDLTINQRDGFNYWIYHDPGAPPYIDTANGGTETEEYQWNFSMVLAWSAHLDPLDGVMLDISPGASGNNQSLPQSRAEYANFYDRTNGGDPSTGHTVNPATGEPYAPNMVPRGDYVRVLAEFWADGPDSETPPGHWFVLLNHVNDQPELEKRFRGQGTVLDELEWDVKGYFALAGAMQDSAVTAWGIKGWYDYIRPVSAIRAMADLGQSSDPEQPNYHVAGLPLIPGLIELVTSADALLLDSSGEPLTGQNFENVGKLKVYAWRGPDYIPDPKTFIASVGWILVENWWPYQRPSFVTPPFAGYVSGHSTYSRAAAEVLTLLTGDAYFPGGMGEFKAPQNDFLVFEKGPNVDVTLQWATYRDASDQCSLSRIWGGIHPPADDIPGRLIGEQIGIDAFNLAQQYFGN